LFGVSCNDSATPDESKSPLNTSQPTTSTKKEEEKTKKKNVLFFGDSLTAAYQLDPSDGYTTILQQRIDSLGLNYKVINAGNSGETSAGGKERIGWVLRQPVDVFLLELGANDGLRGIDTESTIQNLQSIIDNVKGKYPNVKIIIAGMEAPPNMGEKFTSDFRNIFRTLAEKNNAALIPFFLNGVAGIPELNLKDGIHPNIEGQKVVAENVWNVLKGIL